MLAFPAGPYIRDCMALEINARANRRFVSHMSIPDAYYVWPAINADEIPSGVAAIASGCLADVEFMGKAFCLNVSPWG